MPATLAATTLDAATETAVLTKPSQDTLAIFSLSGTYGTAVFVFEASRDGTTNFSPIAAIRVDTGAILPGGTNIAPTDNGEFIYHVPNCQGCKAVRVWCVSIVSGAMVIDGESGSFVGVSPLPVSTQAATTTNGLTVTGDLVVSGGDIDAGSSGAAGTLDIFPTTAAKGKLQITAADQTGDTTVSLTTAAMAAARTITFADPLAAADVLLGKQAAVARTATADGLTTGTIADGGKLQFVVVTSADANHIIVLPTPTPGTIIILHNGATGYELRSSAPTTVLINGGTGGAAVESAIPANSTAIMICVTATAWKGFFLDADSDLAKVEAAA